MSFFSSAQMSSRRSLPEGSPPPRFGRFAIGHTATGAGVATIEIRANANFINLSQPFESVELLECEAEVSVPASDTPHCIAIAFVPKNDTAQTKWNEYPFSKFIYNSKTTSTTFTLTLTPDHNFGRELKATVLGNAAPVLRFSLPADGAHVQLRFRAAFHGSALG